MVMKVLCLGNNTEDTDVRTHKLADQNQMACHGLLTELDGLTPDIASDGYYHTSVYDIEFGNLLELCRQVNQVIVLDQPKSLYTHPDAFYKTIRLAKQARAATSVIFIDPSYEEEITFFEDLVKTNKSFCIFPFIELLVENGNTTVCGRSTAPITKLSDLKSFKDDPGYSNIRTKMLNGELLPTHCSACYRTEALGMISARQQETVEWSNRLNLSSLADLSKIENPAFYEIRPSNVCNLQCRMCNPDASHLIAREYKKLNLIANIDNKEYTNFDFVNFNNLTQLYVAGGEPTAMPEFYDFVSRCIDQKQTNFEFIINTNATKINARLREQLQSFDNVGFIVSIDGLGDINHYVRWPSNWINIVDNVKYLRSAHIVTFNTTVSIYNITNLYQLFEFFDQEFPGSLVHAQLAITTDDVMSALMFPYPNVVLRDLRRIKNLNCYKNDGLLSSFINGLIDHYENHHRLDIGKLIKFFQFNDRLDLSRNIKLADYIPVLENTRHLTHLIL